jgi:hypothetical protein
VALNFIFYISNEDINWFKTKNSGFILCSQYFIKVRNCKNTREDICIIHKTVSIVSCFTAHHCRYFHINVNKITSYPVLPHLVQLYQKRPFLSFIGPLVPRWDFQPLFVNKLVGFNPIQHHLTITCQVFKHEFSCNK